jgi:ADP-ribosylglycohydrolase
MMYRERNLQWLPATLECTAAEVRVRCGDLIHSAPLVTFPNGESDPYATIAQVARQLLRDGVELKGCASCGRFRFSGMSQQMSGGFAGYCGLVGFRNRRGVVPVSYGCGEHLAAAGWPDDLEKLQAERLALADREPAASRLPAFEGAMLGLAIGDALGMPAEFRRRRQILEAWGPQGITDFVDEHAPVWPPKPILLGTRHPPGAYSDDTQMTLAVAEALVAAGGKDLDSLMQEMGEKFVAWSRSPDNNRAPGATCMQGCDNLAAGIPWHAAGVPSSKGCGSAMRVAPIGLIYWRDHARLLEVARASSLLTHGHDAAVEGAAAGALLVALAMEKKTPEAMYDALLAECAPRSADFRTCLEKLSRFVSAEPAVALSKAGLGEGWVAEEAVVSALYCFWRSPEDYSQTVLLATNTDGDSDSIACIAGSISGAFNGVDSIPLRWRERVENAGGVIDLARRLSAASAKPQA